MTMYLLLRNNKQSGPHSVEELKSMGLKAYDLVWLEGKSAAWRYPCEIGELSAFAPPVDEQPFDRFYKKASPAASATATGKPAEIPVTVESTKTPGKRTIYVTMPAGKSPAPVREPAMARESVPSRELISSRETTNVREASLIDSAREPAREPIRELPPREPALEPLLPAGNTSDPSHLRYASGSSYATATIEDYSAQLNGRETANVEFAPRRATDRSPRVIRFLAIGGSILALLAAGIFIGLSLNKDSLVFQHRIVATVPSGQSIVHTTAQQLPVPAAATPAVVPGRDKPTDSVATIVSQPVRTDPPVNSETRNGSAAVRPSTTVPSTTTVQRTTAARSPMRGAPKEKPAHLPTQSNLIPVTRDSAAGVVPVEQHREAVHRTDITVASSGNPERETGKASLANQVSVGANGYTVGTFGGINDLQLTVTNRSGYPLDVVIVEVQYIQANKKVYKTENMYFHGIGAGSALMLEAPKSSRGIKVQYKITTITSKELGLSYSGI